MKVLQQPAATHHVCCDVIKTSLTHTDQAKAVVVMQYILQQIQSADNGEQCTQAPTCSEYDLTAALALKVSDNGCMADTMLSITHCVQSGTSLQALTEQRCRLDQGKCCKSEHHGT